MKTSCGKFAKINNWRPLSLPILYFSSLYMSTSEKQAKVAESSNKNDDFQVKFLQAQKMLFILMLTAYHM